MLMINKEELAMQDVNSERSEQPPAYPNPQTILSYPAASYPSQGSNQPAMQDVNSERSERPPVYPNPQTTLSYPDASYNSQGSNQPAPTPPPVPIDPAIAAATAGQQYRDQLFALCASGHHERTTTYGIFGIITAVVCFPCGLICLFADTQEKCARCGVSLS